MAAVLDINSDACVVFANKLEKISRSALPSAIRNTLNTTAFNVKTVTMPKEAKSTFTERKPNFFKANSKVVKASGFNVQSMKATVGFVPLKGDNKAVDELEQQEHGGTIDNREFIPMKGARQGGSDDKQVKANFRLNAMRGKKVINAEKVRFKNGKGSQKQKFIRAAFRAKKEGGANAFVLGNKWGGGKQTLSRIDKVSRGNGTISIKRTPLYTFQPNRKIKVARTNFMKRASLESGLQLDKNFQNAAIFQLKKYMNK